jgi:hypothetical protein
MRVMTKIQPRTSAAVNGTATFCMTSLRGVRSDGPACLHPAPTEHLRPGSHLKWIPLPGDWTPTGDRPAQRLSENRVGLLEGSLDDTTTTSFGTRTLHPTASAAAVAPVALRQPGPAAESTTSAPPGDEVVGFLSSRRGGERASRRQGRTGAKRNSAQTALPSTLIS